VGNSSYSLAGLIQNCTLLPDSVPGVVLITGNIGGIEMIIFIDPRVIEL
jgi:hypothetical protein